MYYHVTIGDTKLIVRCYNLDRLYTYVKDVYPGAKVHSRKATNLEKSCYNNNILVL